MLVTQVAAVLLLLNTPGFETPYRTTFVLFLPAVAGGTSLGLRLLKRVEAQHFRTAILVLLILFGATLVA
jgi:hypothetical protein